MVYKLWTKLLSQEEKRNICGLIHNFEVTKSIESLYSQYSQTSHFIQMIMNHLNLNKHNSNQHSINNGVLLLQWSLDNYSKRWCFSTLKKKKKNLHILYFEEVKLIKFCNGLRIMQKQLLDLFTQVNK